MSSFHHVDAIMDYQRIAFRNSASFALSTTASNERRLSMKLYPFDVPVAVSMLDLVKTATEPFQQFICYWIAFNNIYAVTADMNGLSAFVITKPDGSPKTRVVANVEIAVSSG